MAVIAFGTKLYLYIDDKNDSSAHGSKYLITGYVKRPDYAQFSEYTKDKKFSTCYDPKRHSQVLDKWKTDLNDKKYNKSRKNENIKVANLKAVQAIEEFIIIHGIKELEKSIKSIDISTTIKKAKNKAVGSKKKCEHNVKTDIQHFKDEYAKYANIISTTKTPMKTKHVIYNYNEDNDNDDPQTQKILQSLAKDMEEVKKSIKKNKHPQTPSLAATPNTRNMTKYTNVNLYNPLEVIRHFENRERKQQEENTILIEQNAVLNYKNKKLTQTNNNLKKQVKRAKKQFNEFTGKQYKKKKLKAVVQGRQMYSREAEARKLIESCGFYNADTFVFNQFKKMYKHNKEFKAKINKITLPNIVTLLNKGIKDDERDPDKVELYFTLNTCAHNSQHDQNTMRIGLWEKYYDKKKEKWRRRRKKDKNGILLSMGVSPNQFRKLQKRFHENYPSLLYIRPEQNIWHLMNPIACLITYIQEWIQNKQLVEICPYHEERLQTQYAVELAALEEGEILTIKPDYVLNNELQIDAFPIGGCIFTSASHLLWVLFEFFSKHCATPLLTILPAFTTVTDKAEETKTLLNILEPFHKRMETEGIKVPSLNLPLEIHMRIHTFVGGDAVFASWIRGISNQTTKICYKLLHIH